MGLALRHSTAGQEIPLGHFLDSTDGDSEETGLTIANTDINLWKNGAITLANKNSGGATHMSKGIFHATLDATDTNTVGPMVVFVHIAGALAVRLECHVYEEAIYDAIYGASAAGFDSNQRVDVGSWLGTAVTTSATTAKPEVDVNSVSDDATAANNLELDYDGTGLARANSTIGTVTTLTGHTPQTGDSFLLNTLSGTASAGSSTTITLAGGVATDDFYNGSLIVITGGTGAGQSRTCLNYVGSTTVATVTRDWAVAPDATSTFIIVGADVPAILEAGTAQAGAAGSITLDAGASSINNTYTNNHIMITGGTGVGQTRLIGAYNGTTKVANVIPNWTTTPNSSSVYQILPEGRVDVGGWSGNIVTGDGDWAQLQSDATAILVDTGTTLDDHLTDIKGTGFAKDTHSLTDILADTSAIAADIDTLKTRIPDTISLANINGEVVDALNVDTYAEPGQGAPPATTTIQLKLGYLYKFARNKIEQTATTMSIYDDAGTIVDQKSTVSDDGVTFTRGEIVTGP